MRNNVFNLDEGPVIFQYPSVMTSAEARDVHDWLALQLRIIDRMVVNAAPDAALIRREPGQEQG